MRISRLTSIERDTLIPSPQGGYIIYNADTGLYEKYNPATNSWQPFSYGSLYEKPIERLSDLPSPVAGVITLPNDGILYSFGAMIDLEGNEIKLGSNVFRGISQELAGIENGIVRVLETCTISDFRFNNVEMIIDTPTGAFDWSRVNFYNCPNVMDIVAADNIIFETFGFINSENFKISGTINSIVLSPNCIFRSAINPTATYFRIENTAVINRRIRVENSVFQTSAVGQKAVEFVAGASIPDERFRFTNVLFQGIGTALTGINGNDIKALFVKNEGGNVFNSARIGIMKMKNNTTPTVFATAGVATKIQGIFTSSSLIERFEYDSVNNCLIYKGAIPATFDLYGSIAVVASANKEIGGYICITKNGNAINPEVDKLTDYKSYIPSATSGRLENITLIAVAWIEYDDKLYMALENTTDTTNVTAEIGTLICKTATV
jgi:hypothetical protein